MRRTEWLAFVVLCLVSGSRWLLTDTFAITSSGQALDFAVIAVVCGVISRRLPADPVKVALLSVLFLPLPLGAFALAEGHVTPYTQTVVFTLVPAVVVFVIAQQTQAFGLESGTRTLLAPALAGVFGTMLLIPVTVPASFANQLRLGFVVAAMICSSVAAVYLHRLLAGRPLIAAVGVVSATCAVVLGLPGVHTPLVLHPQDFLFRLILDAGTLLLTVYVLRGLHPVSASVRFLLIPLVTIAEGIVVLRPQPSASLVAGVVFMGFASFVLLRYKPPEIT